MHPITHLLISLAGTEALPLAPPSSRLTLSVPWQRPVNAWPNVVVTVVLLALVSPGLRAPAARDGGGAGA